MNVSTPAIILKTMNYSESSKIVYAYTKEFGKQTLIAKGTRRAKSKFGSSLELCSFVELKYFKKSNRELFNLTNAELIKKSFIDKMPYVDKILCLMLCESIFKLEKDEISDTIFFDKIESLFSIAAKSNIFNYKMFIYSQLELANSIGHSIFLSWDKNTKIDYSSDNYVYLDLSNCKLYSHNEQFAERKLKFKLNELLILKDISKGNINANISRKDFKRLVYLFESYFSYHSENKFQYKSIELLD